MKRLLYFPITLLAAIVGKFSWQAPFWLQKLVRLCRGHKSVAALAVVVALAGVGGYLYLDSLPKPISVAAQITPLQITPNRENAKPDTLRIQFDYDFSDLNPDQPRPEGDPSVARIDLVGKTISKGVELLPAHRGTWQWIDDRRLEFVPELDWPAGTEYRVTFDSTIFAEGTHLTEDSYRTTTPAFSAQFINSEFYQDPQDATVRRVVATLSFSHPVESASLQQHLSLSMRPSGDNIDVAPKPYPFKVTFDKNQREAYIQSDPVVLPDHSNYMTIAVDEGVKSLLGGAAMAQAESTKVLIPDVYSFLKINSSIQLVRNQSDEPEQIVTLDFTDDISAAEINSKVAFYLLPSNGEPGGKSYWRGPREVSDSVLQQSEKLDVSALPNERDFAKLYSFKIDLPENRYLYLKIEKGLTSVNQFVYSSFYDNVLRTPNYPKEVNIVGSGSVLANSGNHKLSFLSRGLNDIQFSIGRVREQQLYHLISQTSGDIANPQFNNWSFNEQNIAQSETQVVHLDKSHPKQANYASVDLSPYLTAAKAGYGLFFVDAWGYDRQNKRIISNAHDKRLILITDLGIIVKNNADASHDLFVQSTASGNPVAGARVELLGKNGIPVFSGQTDATGRLTIPSTKGLNKEKEPTVYLVRSAGDVSFIPFNRASRQINLSRFDIGGVYIDPLQQNTLNGYLFSDRGIYRPGEEITIGMLVRNAAQASVENLPLELVVRGPRNRELKVNKFTLPTMGFADFKFPTEPTSDTGEYQVSLHLVRDNRWRGREIGRTGFKVEEFQPDTMKIESKLLDVVDKGWNDQDAITARVALTNLFGTPAQDRKLLARLQIQPHNFYFKDYQDYIFTDPFFSGEKPLSLNTVLQDQRSNADGVAEFALDVSRFKQGTYRLTFEVEGFDQAGGRSVRASNSALISPLQFLVGYKADGRLDYINAKAKRSIEFIAIDKQLQQKEANNLTLKLKEIQHISTLVKQNNGTYKYQTVAKERELASSALTLAAGGFTHTIDTSTGGDYVLEIIDAQQHHLARVPYSVVGAANLAGTIDKNAELQLKLNKADYLPGEMIEMQIKAPYTGSGLITIESDRVHNHQWFKTTTESSTQRIKIPAGLEGNGYVNVAFVRDAGSKEVFVSPLSYGVQPFSIDKSKRKLDINLAHKNIVRPGKPMQIEFSTQQPARLAVFAVDEGILQVANYPTPDPLAYFLKKRALGVQTLQMLDLLLPDFDIVRELSAEGGGMRQEKSNMGRTALAKNLNPFSRKLDKPAVFWSGIVDADENTRSIAFDVPDTFSGQLRVMAVAANSSAVGATHDYALVRGPFVISPNVLTQVAPGDEFLATVGVANIIEGSGKGVKVKLEVSASEQLEIIGDAATELDIDEGGEAQFTVKVRVKDKLGAASLSFVARHGEERASRSASLSVRPATTYYTTLTTGYDKAGEVTLDQSRQLYSEFAEQSAAASASPLVIVDGLTHYLEHFPHGCTEQVVSQVFPLVGLMTHPAYQPYAGDVRSHFNQLILKLRERQVADGGFAFWPGHTHSAAYPSIYVLHFLLEAGELGYPVPGDMLQRGKEYLKQIAASPASSLPQARDRANAIYLLTRLGEVTTNFLVDLEEGLKARYKNKWQPDLLAVYMAATYQLLQKDQEAARLVQRYQLGEDSSERDDFHSPLAQDAQYIYLLSKHFADRAKALDGEQVLRLTDRIFKGEYNTLSSAYSILALGAYSQLVLANNSNEQIAFTAVTANGDKVALPMSLSPFATTHFDVDTRRVAIKGDNAGDNAIFYLNSQSGFDRQPPDTTTRQGLEIFRSFVDADGNEVTRFEQGKELTVKLKIRALDGRSLTNIAVIDLLPGGFEVVRSSVDRTAYGWRADYVDIREDRVVYYGSFDSTLRELTYKVKLTAAGEFTIPPSYAESMYDRSIRAIAKGGTFTVIPSQ